ncbi:SWIM zinc finger family protein [Haloarcula sp. Atlit-7R]|uniref:SWIM zinc finger family protein n=1 Tax=Haloarcula sp. Atlit-7R TaxID=2282125 RepID=UPI000EF17505|nr:SWIM zinc finger family protein [Haloarcula sp. Atlit-7R]RLM91165.1 hypothetical protein D3D01_16745 [Haloarcula sp. Atlit-7R]
MAVTDSSAIQDDEQGPIVDGRDRRARKENMDVALLRQGGLYEVQSESGARYEVDLLDRQCSCPDGENPSTPSPCKHVRRVELELEAGQIPRPDGRLPQRSDAGQSEPVSRDSEVRFKSHLLSKIQRRENELAHLDAEVQALQFVYDVIEEILEGDDFDLKTALSEEYGPASQL